MPTWLTAVLVCFSHVRVQYLRNMKQDKTWGGNIELQAMSLLFRTNIAIYQLNSPRWDISTLGSFPFHL